MTIKMSELANEIRNVATAMPDVLYQVRAKALGVPARSWSEEGNSSCRYQADGHGCCLVGVALANLGVPIERLAEYDGPSERSFYGVTRDFPSDFEFDDDDAEGFIRTAQERQDQGLTWAEAAGVEL